MMQSGIFYVFTWIENVAEVFRPKQQCQRKLNKLFRCFTAGDPISITVHRHPHKKHFGKPADDTNYDPAKPHMPLAKVKLHLSDYDELDPYAAKDTEFIVNVPFQKHTGDFIEVMIGDKVISVQIPPLNRRQNRFIVCFIE